MIIYPENHPKNIKVYVDKFAHLGQVVYKVKRLPRQIFYIDVGNIPSERVKQYLKEVKESIRGNLS